MRDFPFISDGRHERLHAIRRNGESRGDEPHRSDGGMIYGDGEERPKKYFLYVSRMETENNGPKFAASIVIRSGDDRPVRSLRG